MSDLGRKQYEDYGNFVHWKNFQGNPMPKWDELPQTIRGAWAAVAQGCQSDGQADMEFRFQDDGTVKVVDRMVVGEYDHNVGSYTLSKEFVDDFLRLDGPWNEGQAAATDREEWHEDRLDPPHDTLASS